MRNYVFNFLSICGSKSMIERFTKKVWTEKFTEKPMPLEEFYVEKENAATVCFDFATELVPALELCEELATKFPKFDIQLHFLEESNLFHGIARWTNGKSSQRWDDGIRSPEEMLGDDQTDD